MPEATTPRLPPALRPPAEVGTVTVEPLADANMYRLLMSGRPGSWFAIIQFTGELFTDYQEAVLKRWAECVSEVPEIPEATEGDFKRMELKRLQPVEVLDAIRDALEPLAVMADTYDPEEGDDDLRAWGTRPTLGNLRAARRAYKALGFGRFALAPMALMDGNRPMETEAGKMTAAEDVLNWLLAEKCDCDTGRPYTPAEAMAIIEARIDRGSEAKTDLVQAREDVERLARLAATQEPRAIADMAAACRRFADAYVASNGRADRD